MNQKPLKKVAWMVRIRLEDVEVPEWDRFLERSRKLAAINEARPLATRLLAVYFVAVLAVLLAILAASSAKGDETPHFRHERPAVKPVEQEPAKPKAEPAASPVVRSVMYFGAPWCIPCRANKPTLEALKRDGYSVVDYAPDASGNVFVVDGDTAVMDRFKVHLIPMWVAFEDGKEVKRQQGTLAPADVKALLRTPKAFSVPKDSDGASMIEQVLRFTGPSGTFTFTPDSQIKATTDNGVTVTYSVIQGKYETDGKTATITLEQPYPHVDGRVAWGLFHYGASLLGGEYDPPTATIRTSMGKYKITLEPAE